jgi:hypothetical protein
VQNQPDPHTPLHERRWLDRLRAAWDEMRARPTNKATAEALEAVAQERPEEANYRIATFAADAARRTSSTPPKPSDDSRGRGGHTTPDSDRFDDEAGQ